MQGNQTCIPLFTKDLQSPFKKVPFYATKEHLYYAKPILLDAEYVTNR